ncbi:MAG: hypothetical protein GY847_37085 [Proteobacteria bacterium]|nr:hypothetical protein [Pseudomonadota bacterium]
MSDYDYTKKQGQYLAFIYNYTIMHRQPPSEVDMQRFFRVTAPTIHQMVLRLENRGFITRIPRKARTIQVLVPPEQLPHLQDPSVKDPGKKNKSMPAQAHIYQIKVTLDESKPPIWRRILVSGNSTLSKFHHILQVTMGWTDSHLHQFIVGQTYFGEPHPDAGFDVQDERRVKLKQIVPGEGFKFRYEYDFGDSWLHNLLVEKVLEPEPGQQYPVCVKGKRACPPEDVGGVWGYDTFLEAIRNSDHLEHDMYTEWIGSEFNSEAFDLDKTNQILRDLR